MAAGGGQLLAKRLVVVSGKGGVGKSTVAAALGVVAARRGLRTVVAEVAGRADVAHVLGGEAADRLGEIEVYSGLHHVTIERRPALEEYLRDELPGPLPAGILARSRAFADVQLGCSRGTGGSSGCCDRPHARGSELDRCDRGCHRGADGGERDARLTRRAGERIGHQARRGRGQPDVSLSLQRQGCGRTRLSAG